MKTKIQKWGNSLAVRIPNVYAKEVDLRPEDKVNIILSEGKIVVTPLKTRKYDLEDLLAGITENNLHTEIKTGGPVGKETW